jgi:hypothetical protein
MMAENTLLGRRDLFVLRRIALAMPCTYYYALRALAYEAVCSTLQSSKVNLATCTFNNCNPCFQAMMMMMMMMFHGNAMVWSMDDEASQFHNSCMNTVQARMIRELDP